MRVPINLATEPLQGLRPVRTAVAVAAVLLLLWTVLLVRRNINSRNAFRSQTDQIEHLEIENAALRKEQQELLSWMNTPDVQRIRERSAFLNSIIVQKSLSWTRMFLDLEKTLPADARITGIRPTTNDAQEAQLSLTVASASMPPLIEFMKNLEESPQFGTTAVGAERFPTDKDPQSGIQLDLTTRYRPATESSAPAAAADAPTQVSTARPGTAPGTTEDPK